MPAGLDLRSNANALTARALLVAASRADTTAAIPAAQRMEAHTAAPTAPKEPSTVG